MAPVRAPTLEKLSPWHAFTVADCGPFAIAFATSLAFGQEIFEFLQDKL